MLKHESCKWIGAIFLVVFIFGKVISAERSFKIDYKNGHFLKNGVPFNYISGSIHYFRVPEIYWKDRLLKMKAAGLDTISTYVAWNYHEPNPGEYHFEGKYDVEKFIKIADSLGLLVILRPGPYICAEWDMGGLPWWLLKDKPNIKLRSSDPAYMTAVRKWLNVLLPKIKPLLYENGGPIISVQVENEYGSYFACDSLYLSALRDLFLFHLGGNVVLFTTDGFIGNALQCGTVTGVLPTVDFSGEVNLIQVISKLRQFSTNGPIVNSEFYVGWLNHWQQPNMVVKPESIIPMLYDLLWINASVNMYMFHGGSNFEYYNGANFPPYLSQPTSYDYGAPISETGELTPKYHVIKDVISRFRSIPEVRLPPQEEKYAYGKVEMKFLSTVSQAAHQLSWKKPIKSSHLLSMEEAGQGYGFVMYQHKLELSASVGSLLKLPIVKDRAYIMIDGIVIGLAVEEFGIMQLPFNVTAGQNLNILVENQGRVNYETFINDTKGLFGRIVLNSKYLENWKIFCLDFNVNETVLNSIYEYSNNILWANSPSLFIGHFKIPLWTDPLKDTILNVNGWRKGQVFINGNNVGRYWTSAGPQMTLYIPASFLKPHPEVNRLIVLELEKSPCLNNNSCYVEFTTNHIINAYTSDMINFVINNHVLSAVSNNFNSGNINQTFLREKGDIKNGSISTKEEIPSLESLLRTLLQNYQVWVKDFSFEDHKETLTAVIKDFFSFSTSSLNGSENILSRSEASCLHNSYDLKSDEPKNDSFLYNLKKFHIFLSHFTYFEELFVIFMCLLCFILLIFLFYSFLSKGKCLNKSDGKPTYHLLRDEDGGF